MQISKTKRYQADLPISFGFPLGKKARNTKDVYTNFIDASNVLLLVIGLSQKFSIGIDKCSLSIPASRNILCGITQKVGSSVVLRLLLPAFFAMFCSTLLFSQGLTNERIKTFLPQSDTVKIDTLGIVPNSLLLFSTSGPVDTSTYRIFPLDAKIVFHGVVPTDSLVAKYRVFPIDFFKVHRRYSTDLIRPESEYRENPYTYTPGRQTENIFGTTSLNKSGSISRGVGFGNNQDLTVNSSLSLQLSGKLTENINVLASVSDDNIPIQPEGNTAQLQEFDQVYIQLFDDRSKLTAGDFVIDGPVGYFTRYHKRAQGASFSTEMPLHKNTTAKFYTQTSLALSRGKYARNEIPGVEGNQGPYRLRGNENEPFIIVIAGTEQVFIDGRQMERGQDRDYTIDYNTAEITFTTKQPINKDKRITVEFQYSDANYARSLIQTSTGLKDERYSVYVNFFSEQDAKNQPLQQDLGDAERRILSEAGNDLTSAIAPGYESVNEFTNDIVLYTLRDSLGYDSVFVRATSDVPNLYRVVFSDVGDGNGDYVQEGFDATGRIYKWVVPENMGGTIIHAGKYAPIRQLVAPKKNQMLMVGATYAFSTRTEAMVEGGFSNANANTFSDIGNQNNYSPALTARVNHKIPLSDRPKATVLKGSAAIEWIGDNFQPLEPYRTVEFSRDWNLPLDISHNEQRITTGTVALHKTDAVAAEYSIRQFSAGDAYSALKNGLVASANLPGFSADFNGSMLHTEGENPSKFVRHKSRLEKSLFFTKLGFSDEREDNRRMRQGGDSLSAAAYKFYDWQVYLTQHDSSNLRYRLFYGERSDFAVDSDRFEQATHAKQYGAELTLAHNPNNRLTAMASNRILEIKDAELTNIEPESTLLLRLEHNLRLWKNAVTTSTYYEIGSGLERKKEFIYIQDPTGQGPFTWIDYNENSIKELNEFEVARPEDGDRYIRVFTPTDNYERTYSNKYSQTLNLNPAGAWSGEEGFLKLLSKFSNQTAFRIERKTRREEDADRYNPFVTDLGDSVLVSQSSSIRNTLFFNRSNPKFALDYGYAALMSTIPLTTGFEERNSFSHILRGRLAIANAFSIALEQELGQRESTSDILSGRTYRIDYFRLKQILSYQPGTDLRVSLSNEYTDKTNAQILGGETATLLDIGLDFRLSKVESGIFSAKFNIINIDYEGASNNSLAYEMLDGLQNGRNFTWGAGVQRNLGKNLQRKSEEVKAIHTGNVQVRAFF